MVEVNKQLHTINLYEKIFLSISRLPNQGMHKVFTSFTMIKTIMSNFTQSIIPLQALWWFSDTLGYILLTMHKINQDKAQMLTDTVQSYGAWYWDAECSSQERSSAGPLSLLRCMLPLSLPCKTKAEHYFHKSKNSLWMSFS